MIQDRCHELLGTEHPLTLMTGDFNAELKDQVEFDWVGYEHVFREGSPYAHIATYYADPIEGVSPHTLTLTPQISRSLVSSASSPNLSTATQ
jgi:hypothetical protein